MSNHLDLENVGPDLGQNYLQRSCTDAEGGKEVQTPPPPPPLKNHKNIGFLSDTGLDPLKNHKATEPAFNVGPSSDKTFGIRA